MPDPPRELHATSIPPRAEGRYPPLLVLLHGMGSDETDLAEIAPLLDPRFHIVSVRAPFPHPPGWSWLPTAVARDGGLLVDEEYTQGVRDRLASEIRKWIEAYGTDPWRTYLLGFSQGAGVALHAAVTVPGCAAGAVVLSGRLNGTIEFEASAAVDGLPVFVAHGTHDAVVPVEQGRAIRKFLEIRRMRVEYREYPSGHEASAETLADVARWLADRLDEGGWGEWQGELNPPG
ncbi:MAG: alpha/beta hydrolase [Armatimonadota bacterium]